MAGDHHSQADFVEPLAGVSRHEALTLWWKIGWLSFGGPAGQIALMHRELVERRRWISEGRFLHALNYCMLLPGPEAQQLAIYIGWLLHRTWGGIVAGVLFVIPGFLAMLALSWFYVRYQNAAIVTALFFGLKAGVLAVVVEAVVRIGRRALKTAFMVAISAMAFVAIFFLKISFPWVIAGAALAGIAAQHLRPSWLAASGVPDEAGEEQFFVDRMYATGQLVHVEPSLRRALRVTLACLILWFAPVAIAAAWLGTGHVLVREGTFFSQTAIVTFGGAYAVLAYVAQRAVEDLHWLSPGEMLDGLALAETTPGPLIMVLQFVGFLAGYRYPGPLDPWMAATLGAVLTTWVTFLPCFLFIFLGAPYIEALRRQRALNAALSAITAAVVGVILNLSLWFALHTIFGQVRTHSFGPLHLDVPSWDTLEPGALVISIAALIAMLRFKVGMGWTLLASAGAGLSVGAFYWVLALRSS